MVSNRTASAGVLYHPEPVQKAIERLLGPSKAEQFQLQRLVVDHTIDAFEITGKNGDIVLAGTNNVAILSAFHWYLKYVAGAHLSWNGDQLALPECLPAPKNKIRKETELLNRYMYNYTVFGYTSPYWSWEKWEREIDYLAASGINLALLPIGHEMVWYQTFCQWGCPEEKILDWIVPPAHQPWQWMGNISGFGKPISRNLMKKRVALGNRIAERMRELGITPVFPGFNGIVPPCFTEKHPDAHIIPQGDWFGYPRPDWLNPTDPLFSEVAAGFYRNQAEQFGETTYFATDILHEGGDAGGVNLSEAAHSIQQAMLQANPASVWVIQAWRDNPRKEVIEGINKKQVLVLDLESDEKPRWKRGKGFWGSPWAWGIIQNYGGQPGIYGNLYEIAVTLPEVFHLPESERGLLSGLSQTMEGTHHNPVVMDLFGEMAWRSEQVDLQTWISQYISRRYGQYDKHAINAWEILLKTAYSKRMDGHTSGNGHTESLFTAQPDLNARRSHSWGPTQFRYDPYEFDQAYVELLQVHPNIRQRETYRYDLVDVTREVLANRGRLLLEEIRQAYEKKDLKQFNVLADRYLYFMDLSEDVLATHQDWLLGPWLQDAKKWGGDEAERRALEYDARSIITIWAGETASQTLHEYANREWAGLMGDYYKKRWKLYFDTLIEALQEGKPPRGIDWYEMGYQWATDHKEYPVQPKGDTYEVSCHIAQELAKMPGQGKVKLSLDQAIWKLDQALEMNTLFLNQNPFHPAEDVRLNIGVPQGVEIKPLGKTTYPSVPPSGSVTVKWEASASKGIIKDRAVVEIPVQATAIYDQGDRKGQMKEVTRLIYAGWNIQHPYETFQSTEADFSQNGNQFAILAGGRDMWKKSDQYGSIFLRGGATGDTVAVTRVIHQGKTGPWAKAGLMIRSDLTSSGKSGGYVIVAVTPENGFILQWDSNHNGYLDRSRQIGTTTYPSWLKLTKNGTNYTGFYSVDGVSWVEIGSVSLPAVPAKQDIGLFVSAVNAHNAGADSLVEFDGFSVTGM